MSIEKYEPKAIIPYSHHLPPSPPHSHSHRASTIAVVALGAMWVYRSVEALSLCPSSVPMTF
jgi:hypothetical protein